MKKDFNWCKEKKEQIKRYIDGINKLEKLDYSTVMNVYTETLILIRDIELKYHQELHIHFLKNNNKANTELDEIIELLNETNIFIKKHLDNLYANEKEFTFKYIEAKKSNNQLETNRQQNNTELLNNLSNIHNGYIYYNNIISNKELLLKLNLILNYFEKSEVEKENDFL